MHRTPGTPNIVIVKAEKKLTGTIISKPSTVICAIYKKAKEQARRNQKIASFSMIIP